MFMVALPYVANNRVVLFLVVSARALINRRFFDILRFGTPPALWQAKVQLASSYV